MARYRKGELANLPGLWRVDGVGAVDDNDALGRCVTVHFSGLDEMEGLKFPYRNSSLSGKYYSCKVLSRKLLHFTVGSVWKSGFKVLEPEILNQSFLIDTRQCRYVTLREPLFLNSQQVRSLIPRSHFYLGASWLPLSHSRYAVVPVLDNTYIDWMIIPVSELLRFYTGVSDRFLSTALRGRFDDFVDWSKCRVENRKPILNCKKDLSRFERFVLARAVFDPIAKNALYQPWRFLSKVNAQNKASDSENVMPLSINASFPFEGCSRITVQGKRIPILMQTLEIKEAWAVFAMVINRCSYNFNFNGIGIEGLTKRTGNSLASVEGTGFGAYMSQGRMDYDDFDTANVSADETMRRLAVLEYSNSFPGVYDLVMDIDYGEFEGNPAYSGYKQSDVEAFTHADGNYTSDAEGNLGLSVFTSDVDKVDRDLSLFLDVIRVLRLQVEEKRWRVKTRKSASGIEKDGELISFFPERIGKRRRWHKVKDPENPRRTRQVVWVEVTLDAAQGYFYLIEMELKPGESGQCTILLHNRDFSRLDDYTFLELLFLTAVQNRWPSPHNKWSNNELRERAQDFFSKAYLHRINHPASIGIKGNKAITPEKWSEAILNKVDEKLGAVFV